MAETFAGKAYRKCREEPLVPFGAVLTVGFLTAGLLAFNKGQGGRSQALMRGRVVAQAFTVIAMSLGGMYGLKPFGPNNIRIEDKLTNADMK